MMRRFLLATSTFCVFAACASAPKEQGPADQFVTYTCAHGEQIEVRFSPARRTALLRRGAEFITLYQQLSGSGFIYSNGHNLIRGKGGDLTVEMGPMVPLQCKAAVPPPAQ